MTLSVILASMQSVIKSKQRVADHGEVLTGIREVNAMLDLVKAETERIDSRFLEPACGNGNFLAEVLERKLAVVDRRYRSNRLEFEQYAIQAVSSIYGIDILEDNVMECRNRLFEIVESACRDFFRAEYLQPVRYILDHNIIWGDALTLKTVGENPKPIVFPEWAIVGEGMIKRRDFTFKELLSFEGTKEEPLFSDQGEVVFLPEPIETYPLIHYMKLADADAK